MIGLQHYMVVSAILFVMGVLGIFINRKNVIIILMAIELILLAVNINLVAFSAFLHDLTGQIFAMFVLTVAAAEHRSQRRNRAAARERLAALLRANPQAFVDGNMNRLRAGASLSVPGADDVGAIDAAQAAGAASSGTWTSGRPPMLVPAIDHVMSTSQWEVTGFEVITSADRAGSDHRPVFAELSPTS